ncbi:ATP-binding protein [Kitasatospora sp. NPDC018619]|uniref:ATP-binding protein n=1 Tax=unclassified Kitasatospora TaxID=2633591 RepID=UPI00379DBF7B
MTMSRGTLAGDPRRTGPVPPGGGQRRRLMLAGVPQPVARARAHTVQALDDWGGSPRHAEDPGGGPADVVLVVAELVANAMLHGNGPLELVLDLTTARLRVEVSDRSPALPAPRRPYAPALPGGHGLVIVERVADRWGAEAHAQGKTIWAEFDLVGPVLGG